MKKSLVLAMAMALGVTASAYAANPFSDVPAGHWAYDSVNRLAAAGVIEGYGDTTFGGDRLMTRYEMAQIVAKAMAKGANVDKLAAEFADELDNLGVRVANLEKKADNVKVTGEIRYKYMSTDNSGYENDLRSRIWVTGQVNDDWSYTGMLENIQDFKNDSGDETTKFQRAYVEGKIGGVDVLAGRYNAFFANGNIYDARVDGVELTYGNKYKIKGMVGKASDGETLGYLAPSADSVEGGDYAGVEISAALGDNLNVATGYISFKDIASDAIGKGYDDNIWYIGGDYTYKDIVLTGMILLGDGDNDTSVGVIDGDKKGGMVGISYKGAEADVAGSWGVFFNFYRQNGGTYIAHTTDANVFDGRGFKGYGLGANYTFAKNMVGTVVYYDTEELYGTRDDQRIWTDLTFTF